MIELRVIDQKLDIVLNMLRKLNQEEEHMSAQLDALTAQVTALKTVADKTVTALASYQSQVASLTQQLAASGADTTALKGLSDQIAADIAEINASLPAAPVS